MTRVALGLGSNLGCKVGNIRRAIRLLSEYACIQDVELSSFYKTAPVGNLDQDWFVNAVARFETSLSAMELLGVCLEVERELKRVRTERWGPRTLDLDILFYGEEVVQEDKLQVPHPRIRERAFVLHPLLELDPESVWDGEPLAGWLAAVADQGIERMEPVVAVLGASEKPERYAHLAQSMLMERGYAVAAVARRGELILGQPVFRSLLDCGQPVDTVTLYVGSARVGLLLDDILQACPRRVIFNPGTENAELRAELESQGIETWEACTLVLLRTGQF